MGSGGEQAKRKDTERQRRKVNSGAVDSEIGYNTYNSYNRISRILWRAAPWLL